MYRYGETSKYVALGNQNLIFGDVLSYMQWDIETIINYKVKFNTQNKVGYSETCIRGPWSLLWNDIIILNN